MLATQAIANVVKSSFGPSGLDKMMVDDIGVCRTKPCVSGTLLRGLGCHSNERWGYNIKSSGCRTSCWKDTCRLSTTTGQRGCSR